MEENDLNEFFKEKMKLEKELMYGSTIDMNLHYQIGCFLNKAKRRHWYIIRGETFTTEDQTIEKYKFLRLLTQVFLDNADSDRFRYIDLIMKNCSKDKETDEEDKKLQLEILYYIQKFSGIPYLYDDYIKKFSAGLT